MHNNHPHHLGQEQRTLVTQFLFQVLDDETLENGAKLLYAKMLRLSVNERKQISILKLASELNSTPNQILSWMRQLFEGGYLDQEA
jgi:transposase-like protein